MTNPIFMPGMNGGGFRLDLKSPFRLLVTFSLADFSFCNSPEFYLVLREADRPMCPDKRVTNVVKKETPPQQQ